ncbi:MAG: efflux RND transporter permease subunit, partial [Bacteroidota bacterium]|nr:efflux RND transporter permease subunit [Bacteroidota bacterium]
NKLPEEDLEVISDYVKQYVDDFNIKHTALKLKVTYDFLAMLGQRLKLLYNNGGIGLLLVLLSLGLFLSFRLSLWVAWGIPASFLGMFIAASLYGITINMISLFGMILVIGILVDDGIVIAENIYSHFEKGKTPKQAALDGTMEVLPAVFTSVTTTIIAFTPLFFATGRMEFMFEMAFVVIFSLLFSLMEAFFVLPAHLGSEHVLRSNKRADFGANIRRKLESAIHWMRFKFYARILKWTLSWRYIVIIIPVALIMMTVGMFKGSVIKATFFPSIPFDQFNVDVAFKPGDGEKQTLEYLKRFEDAIWEVNEDLMQEYDDTVSFVNHTFVSVGGAFNGQETGTHTGNVFVLLRDLQDTKISSYEVVNRVTKKIGPVTEAEKFSTAGRHTFGTPVSVSLLGKDLGELDFAKAELMEMMKDIPELNNIIDNNSAGKREIRLKLKPKAYFLGLNHADISNQIRQGFFGGQAQRLQVGKDEVRVWVRYPKKDRVNIGQFEDMKIKTPAGDYPLSELANYDIERGPVAIKHFNSSREVRIDADLHDPMEPIPPIIKRIEEKILPEILSKYPGIRYQFLGQQQDSEESMNVIITYFSIAFLIILIILMIHFRSFMQMIIIILMIPIAWLGSVWGHGLEGFPVSMLSAWGMIALSGVIINDAVVFLSKYNSLLVEGYKVEAAAYHAGLARFRPILLTTITTSVGLYPLILQNSFQAQFLIPMAISLAYGVAVGTGFLLLFFPSLIVILNDIRRGTKQLWTGKKPAREEVEKAVIFSKREFE